MSKTEPSANKSNSSRISIKFDQAVIKKQNKTKNNRRKNEGKDNPGKMIEKCLFASTFYLVDF